MGKINKLKLQNLLFKILNFISIKKKFVCDIFKINYINIYKNF